MKMRIFGVEDRGYLNHVLDVACIHTTGNLVDSGFILTDIWGSTGSSSSRRVVALCWFKVSFGLANSVFTVSGWSPICLFFLLLEKNEIM